MTGEGSERRALLALLVATVVLVALVVRPLAEAILLGAVLAAVLWPLQEWLARVFRGRQSLAAAVVVVAVVLLVVGPVVAILAFVVGQADEAIAFVTSVVQSERTDNLVSALPDPIEDPLRRWTAASGSPLDQLGRGLSGAMSTVTATIVATGSLGFQSVMAMLALFFFLSRKEDSVTWISAASPLAASQTRELLAEVRRVSVAIARSTVLTAGVQTLAALVGYVIVGVPYWAFFTGATFVMALIPAIGAALVSLAIAGILLLVDRPVAAVFLATWGLFVVGLSDNLVKPLLIRHGIRMNGVVILFALLGGLGAFGPIGLLVGPLTIAVFVAVLRIYRRDYADDTQLAPES